jgi:hypothetical protein
VESQEFKLRSKSLVSIVENLIYQIIHSNIYSGLEAGQIDEKTGKLNYFNKY